MIPFIHRFETANNKYVYDVNSNRTFKVSQIAYDIVDLFLKYSTRELAGIFPQYSRREIKKTYHELHQSYSQRGVFLPDHPSSMGFVEDESADLFDHIPPHEQLILNVTERCNLRCTYCAFSGLYPGKRTHSGKDMSFDTAKRAIDHFMSNVTKDDPCISFYGGEPLLRIELIKDIIAYAKTLTDSKLVFAMTTNGILLSEEVARFLNEHDFNLMVSLDGPREIHDRYRVDNRGNGYFDVIINNLAYLRHLDQEYYKTKVTFSIVSAPPYCLGEVCDFFSTNPLVKENIASFSYMDYTSENFPYLSSTNDASRAAQDREELVSHFFENAVDGKEQSSFLEAYLGKDFARFYLRPKAPLPRKLSLNGCCFPSERRLFVSTSGLLYVCERMDNAYPIGSVQDWIDKDLVSKLVEDYVDMSSDCFDCWACRLCSACFAGFAVQGAFSQDIRRSECEATRARLHNMLVCYYTALEKDETAWDYMKDLKIE